MSKNRFALFQAAPLEFYCFFKIMNSFKIPGIVEGLILSSENHLDFHGMILSVLLDD